MGNGKQHVRVTLDLDVSRSTAEPTRLLRWLLKRLGRTFGVKALGCWIKTLVIVAACGLTNAYAIAYTEAGMNMVSLSYHPSLDTPSPSVGMSNHPDRLPMTDTRMGTGCPEGTSHEHDSR